MPDQKHSFSIDALQPEDWEAVRQIFLEGIATRNATFETTAPDWPTWDATHLQLCRQVARAGASVLGWAALSLYSRRAVYAGVAEVSIYIGERWRGQGVGSVLLQSLVAESERQGFWTLQSGILTENTASLQLHLSCGFRIVGRRERIGQMQGVWRDVLLLERRSLFVGSSG
jgi:L-amino acid N-acyltransferase YncA